MTRTSVGPLLTTRAVRPLVSGLAALGQAPAPMLARAGIDAATLEDPEASVPMRKVLALVDDAVQVTGDENLGLHLAQAAEPGSFDVHLYAMLSSPTLGDACQCLCRYQRLIHDSTEVRLDIEDNRATLRHRMPGGVAAPRQSIEFLLAAWVRVGRMATGTTWSPEEVRFAHDEPGGSAEHRRFFGSRVCFMAGANALIMPASLLDVACERADVALFGMLDRYAADRLERAPKSASVADRARAALGTALRNGEPSATYVANRLKMSVRTLNRALASEQTSYRHLLEQLRRDLAMRYLADPRLSVTEVAFLLGFSELSAFHRAFRRWTSVTPSAFRARTPRISS
jgi:AraC-like DNA-binding protein